MSHLFELVRPDVVIHCAAYTSVDRAELEVERCKAVNIQGSINVAIESQKIGAKFVFISSDYVFDGEKQGAYETEDKTSPINVYGLTKAIAEQEVCRINSKTFIVRTSWMFGEGKNFVNTMLELAKKQKEIAVVNDQIGSPTYAEDLAKFLYQLVKTEKYGVYHATNEGYCSWAKLAKKIFELKKMNIQVQEITSESYNSIARRPHNSRLSKKSLVENGFALFPDWEEALMNFLR